ncbi:MAG: IS66 family insertion sequence element accessory protein TnpA [Steroidobacteraceae bacterium]
MTTTRWTDEHGREFVQQWQRSGQSMSAFAREQGVNLQRLRYWRWRVEGRTEQGGERRERRTKTSSHKLIPGVVVGIGERAPVTVHVGRRVVVEAQAARDIDPAWLSNVVRALEEQA